MTYLKVKLRRERRVSRADWIDVRDRLENLRSRVNGTDTYSNNRVDDRLENTAPVPGVSKGVVPSGTELDVRLEQALSSDTATRSRIASRRRPSSISVRMAVW